MQYHKEKINTLRNQLLQSHLRVAGLAAITLVLIAFAMQWLKEPIAEIRLVNVPSANAASLVQLGLQRSEANLRGWVALKKPEFRDNVDLAWKEEISPAFESLRNLSNSISGNHSGERQRLLLAIDAKLKRLKKLHDWTMEVSAKAGNEPARLVFSEEFVPARVSLVDTLSSYRGPLHHLGVSVSVPLFKLRLALSEAESALGRFVVEGLEPDAATYRQRIGQVRVLVESSNIDMSSTKLVLKRLDRLEDLSDSIIASRRSPRSNVAWHTISTRVAPLSADIAESFAAIADHEISTMRNQVEKIAKWSDILLICLVLALLIVAVIAAILSNAAAQRISAPITQLFRATDALKNGDYSQTLKPEGVHEVRGLIMAFNSMRKSISRSHRILKEMAYTDELTGLQNRKSFNNHIATLGTGDQRGTGSQGAHCFTGVMMIDLDKFKQLNDSMGHDAGDYLLMQFSCRLQDNLRHGDFAARLGGDEFAVLLRSLSSHTDAIKLVERIQAATSQPVTYRGERITPSATIGIAVDSNHNKNTSDLVKSADLALYDAKANGRGTYSFYSSQLHTKTEKSRRLVELLGVNTPENMFALVYQPFVNLNTGETIGTEAMLRCIHPECIDIPILDVITILERNGNIARVTVWMLEQATNQLSNWQNTLYLPPDFTMSVNVSANLLGDKKFVQSLLDIVKAGGVYSESLTLELTETTVIEDYSSSIVSMQRLNEAGIKFAMDDFGKGYSSMVQLKEMPLSVLKIDKSFVAGMLECSDDNAIVDASLQLGRAMGLLVTAEGIETAEQAEALRALGCARGQGYYFCYPKPAEEIFQHFPVFLKAS